LEASDDVIERGGEKTEFKLENVSWKVQRRERKGRLHPETAKKQKKVAMLSPSSPSFSLFCHTGYEEGGEYQEKKRGEREGPERRRKA
jgi:hypothetical protein